MLCPAKCRQGYLIQLLLEAEKYAASKRRSLFEIVSYKQEIISMLISARCHKDGSSFKPSMASLSTGLQQNCFFINHSYSVHPMQLMAGGYTAGGFSSFHPSPFIHFNFAILSTLMVTPVKSSCFWFHSFLNGH